MMKILVTGGSGSIGKAFIRKYKKDFDIVSPTHEQMDLMDVRSIERMFAAQKFDAVLHLAGAGEKKAENGLEADNLIMFKNIQYVSIAHGVKKLIIVGEGVEFDRSRPISEFTEDKFGESVPTDGYGLARYLINVLAAKDKITTSLRLFEVYGVGAGKTPISRMIAAAAKGNNIVLDSDRIVSAVCIDDVVRVLCEFLKNDYEKGDYNLVSPDPTSYLAVAKRLKRLAKQDGYDLDIRVKNETPQNEYTADNSKLAATLNMRFTSVPNGVKKVYEEIKNRQRT